MDSEKTIILCIAKNMYIEQFEKKSTFTKFKMIQKEVNVESNILQHFI